MRVDPRTCNIGPDFIPELARKADPGENVYASSKPIDIDELDGGFFLRDAEKMIGFSDSKVLLRRGVIYWLAVHEPVGMHIESLDIGFLASMGLFCLSHEIEFGVLWISVTPMLDVFLRPNKTHLGFVELGDSDYED